METTLRNILLGIFLLTVVFYVNMPVIDFDMMYPEQPTIYLANQTISSFHDLVYLYLHPKWLHTNISFFRPSGHFLLYQLLTPLFGWQNTRALFIVSFLFLTGIGYLTTQLYRLLFPTYWLGGLIAFGIYLMHPALSLSRVTLMHFEFAYVFFLLTALNLFVIFCQNQKNNYVSFAAALFLYVLAVTFKEPAIMLGPILGLYLLIEPYQGQSYQNYVLGIVKDKQTMWLLLTLFGLSCSLLWYLTLAWPSYHFPSTRMSLEHSLGTINAFFKDVIGFKQDIFAQGRLPFGQLAWREIVFPDLPRLTMLAFFWLSCGATGILFFAKTIQLKTIREYRKSILFLTASALLFFILPALWGMGAPHHHSLTLLCLALIMGFSVEFLLQTYGKNTQITKFICVCIVLSLVFEGRAVINANNLKYLNNPGGKLGLTLNRNAVYFPPNIKNKLNSQSIIVVEDSTLHNDYFMGNSAYPYLLFLDKGEYEIVQKMQNNFLMQFHHTYSGTLFRYAYLMPSLREEVYPFRIEQMGDVPNEVIYNWLQHMSNIFCVGYDVNGNWLDKTDLFKANLAHEQQNRALIVNQYKTTPTQFKPTNMGLSQVLTVPDEHLCQFTCDQDQQCYGFVYANMQCHYLQAAFSASQQPCAKCTIYSKGSSTQHA